MRYYRRNTPPKYIRGTSDFDYYKEPMHYLERERQERLGCLGASLFLLTILLLLGLL